MPPHTVTYDPIRLKVSGGWVLIRLSRGDLKTYVFQNDKFPNIILEVVESVLPGWLQPYSLFDCKNKNKLKKEYSVNISKKHGFQEVLHVKKFKTFAGIFRDSDLKNLCKFYETKEESYQNISRLCSSEKRDLEEVYSWISNLVKTTSHEWYSPYGLVIHDKNFPLDSGRHEFISYQVQKKNGKTYVDFSVPVGIFEKVK